MEFNNNQTIKMENQLEIFNNTENLINHLITSDKIDYTLIIANRHQIQWTPETQEKFLMLDPNPKWILKHPYVKVEKTINGVKNKVPLEYVPIDKIEFLLTILFKRHRIEVLRENSSFNGVYVVVRVHYYNSLFNEWEYQDGIGAVQLQTKSGSSPADLANINNGALQMAYPSAKTYAIKDACDHIGRIFGKDLNRSNTIGLEQILLAENTLN